MGEIISARYDELAPMPLNEMKLQKQEISALRAEVRVLQASQQDNLRELTPRE